MTSTDDSAGSSADLVLRPAGPEDAGAVAALHLASRRAAEPFMPRGVHPADEVTAHLAGRVAGGTVWVATSSAQVLGYVDVDGDWLDGLYVLPEHAGAGVGSALLDLVKGLRPDGFGLWVFVSNDPARRFYRRRGLLELEQTDGSGNEEGAPDLRMVWPGTDPLRYLRAQMDLVDADLASVLSRRAALTAAIQQVKPVGGHAGRDPAREAQIARRMAERAPCFPVPAWERIMHEVITAGLDAAADGSSGS